MNKLITNPAVVLVLGLVAGLTVGIGWFWRAAEVLIDHATAAKPPSLEVQEQRAQGWDFWTIEIDSLATELKEERARQQRQADDLEIRAGHLEAEQQELLRLRNELAAMKADIEKQVMAITADEYKNLRTLAQTYTNLSPRAAVAIVQELDDATVVKILSLMKPDVVGPIFEELSKTGGVDGPLAKRAATLSEKLRLIKKMAPTETNS